MKSINQETVMNEIIALAADECRTKNPTDMIETYIEYMKDESEQLRYTAEAYGDESYAEKASAIETRLAIAEDILRYQERRNRNMRKIVTVIHDITTEQLVAFEDWLDRATDNIKDNRECIDDLFTVRGWVLDELWSREPEFYEAWLDNCNKYDSIYDFIDFCPGCPKAIA